jgi:hypothetical protein
LEFDSKASRLFPHGASAAGGVTGLNDGKPSQPVSLGGQNDFRGGGEKRGNFGRDWDGSQSENVKGFGVCKILQLLRKVMRETLEILGKMWAG